MLLGGGPGRATPTYTFAANTADASINVASLGGYVAGKSDITITVNSGIYLWASVNTGAGLTLTGGTTGDAFKSSIKSPLSILTFTAPPKPPELLY